MHGNFDFSVPSLTQFQFCGILFMELFHKQLTNKHTRVTLVVRSNTSALSNFSSHIAWARLLCPFATQPKELWPRILRNESQLSPHNFPDPFEPWLQFRAPWRVWSSRKREDQKFWHTRLIFLCLSRRVSLNPQSRSEKMLTIIRRPDSCQERLHRHKLHRHLLPKRSLPSTVLSILSRSRSWRHSREGWKWEHSRSQEWR